ncbi:MAG TPA: DUF6629 family protein [Acidimicrobiales bacterium]|nr:DUF6629 family protein [Acidimicrobiales bacterium]
MCFSPQADTVAGVVVGVIAVDAARHVRDRRDMALAAIPAVFAVHQFLEAGVWLWLRGSVSVSFGHSVLWAYLLVAFALPTLVPLAIWSIEPDQRRRRAMATLLALGVAVSVWLVVAAVTGNVGAHIDGHHIVYTVGLSGAAVATGLYVVATCGSLLLSSSPRLVLFGVGNLVAVALLVWLSAGGLFSLWCAWAAVTSACIALHLRTDSRPLAAV